MVLQRHESRLIAYIVHSQRIATHANLSNRRCPNPRFRDSSRRILSHTAAETCTHRDPYPKWPRNCMDVGELVPKLTRCRVMGKEASTDMHESQAQSEDG